MAVQVLMSLHDGHTTAGRFFTSANANSYDTIASLATFGQDFAWKHEIVKAVGRRKSVLELACGTGVLSSMLADADKRVVGIDLTFEYLHRSKRKMQAAVAQGTAEVLPYRNESFEAVASSYLAKYVDIQMVVDECWRVLRPGGIIVFHDFTYPAGVMRSLWNAHFAMLRLAGRLLTSWSTVFEQLDNLIRNSDWVDQTSGALHSRGFRNIDHKRYTAGTAAIVCAEKP